ncbi:hypothetical protein EPA93_12550 [Ktedonosporobacter rubrisoli]|uniref:Uncharacterized protein n=1 Tax=Ktedonosporobacter rubrisoli TaxID=2509675 RepID=A0A4P6JNA8_KTERU|nr:Os1348 family NHLP clan protein [Ktedonosporobacter rubrisoli]QBD76788.1 hypothetical protein EPA93_12550 [Ktedonosporobacter rubrisoli]
MSWKIINQIICLAYANEEFWQALQANPLPTLQAEGFQLSPEEQETVQSLVALSFNDFCQALIDRYAPPSHSDF